MSGCATVSPISFAFIHVSSAGLNISWYYNLVFVIKVLSDGRVTKNSSTQESNGMNYSRQIRMNLSPFESTQTL